VINIAATPDGSQVWFTLEDPGLRREATVPVLPGSTTVPDTMRLASSQVTFTSFIAAEKSNPGTVLLLLPAMPARDGPILFSPGGAAWHAAQ
jgi:hypothetical protein